ncbi:hypothetical protein LGL55_19385 [Clostridium tagluense]|uniref:hypothetical protein n=1 Tax=Clostridium tagluense TaxID=360422 RepID=UPI001CF133BA|nr:hypothetical protein [Clostridium tagluense]MCB2323950.1 hypothetical protein [Clostridium tagluense]MCB2338537.1 hypothetical protein [Clostridium tagluense]MCB2366362.1 hypothetical protein [Clostridium tagluense]
MGNKYVLIIPLNIKNSISKADLQLAKNRVITLNKLIDQYKVKNVSITNGFTIIIDESTSANTRMLMASVTSKGGVTKIEAH